MVWLLLICRIQYYLTLLFLNSIPMINLLLPKPAYLHNSYNEHYSIQLRSRSNKSLYLSGNIFPIQYGHNIFSEVLIAFPGFQLREFTSGIWSVEKVSFYNFQSSHSTSIPNRINRPILITLFSTRFLKQDASLVPT